MIKAREALAATFNWNGTENIAAALTWLEDDRLRAGAKKAEKIADREAKEGMVGLCILSDGLGVGAESEVATPAPQGGLIEINCETDFVARNEVFSELIRDLSHTAAMFPALSSGLAIDETPRIVDLPLPAFLQFPLMPSSPHFFGTNSPKTVQAAILDAVSRLGENINLARVSTISAASRPAAAAPQRTTRPASVILASAFILGTPTLAAPIAAGGPSRPGYVISGGRVASLLLTRLHGLSPSTCSQGMSKIVRSLARSLARQTAGMETKAICSSEAETDLESALYSQHFMMLLPTAGIALRDAGEESVESVLKRWASKHLGQHAQGGEAAVEVLDLRRWKVGEFAQS